MLIGITGKAGAGKDTLGDYLWRKHAAVRIAFADPLKRAAQEIFGLSDAETWERDLKEVEIPYWGMSPRRMMQLLGTEAMQDTFGRDVWLKRWQQSYDIVKHSDNVVVPDVRFEAEAGLIRALGGVIVKVTRDTDNGLEDKAKAHVSEVSLPDTYIDAVIANNAGFKKLYAEMDSFLKKRGIA